MKKINKTKIRKTSIRRKQFRLFTNPKITTYKEIQSHLKTLIDENVILYMFVKDSNNKNKQIKVYGILKGSHSQLYYDFLFNPLNQYLFQKLSKDEIEKLYKQKIPEYNEEMAIMENELEFMNNEPTMKIGFITASDIDFIDNNEIHIYEKFDGMYFRATFLH